MNISERKRAVRDLGWHAWRAAFLANTIAAVTFGSILAVSVRIYAPEFPYGHLMRQFALVGLSVIPPTIVAILIAGPWLIRRRMAWFIEERAPTQVELRRFASLLRFTAIASVVTWTLIFVGQTAYMTHVVKLPYGSWALPKAAAIYAYGIIVATALAFLLMEPRFRPYHEALLPADVDAWPRSLGIRSRLLVAWLTVSGAPLILIAFTWVGFTPAQRIAAAAPLRSTALIAAAAGLLVFVIAGRTITGPLQRLQSAQRRVAAGDLSVRVELEQSGEIGKLEAGFNEMVEGLRERERMRDVFGRHVGTDVARLAMERNPTLGGEVCDATALFVDVIGSTRIAEHREPDEVVALLNDFFETVVRVVGTEGGFVNQFQGDGALCLFGAPVPQEDHRARGLRAARALLDELASMEGLEAAIGVSSGRVVAGNVGSSDRFDFTVIGDPVNEASRLSDEAKRNRPRVLASEQTVARAESEGSLWSKCKDIRLRGRSVPTPAYSLESA